MISREEIDLQLESALKYAQTESLSEATIQMLLIFKTLKEDELPKDLSQMINDRENYPPPPISH